MTESLYVNPFFAGYCILAQIPLLVMTCAIVTGIDEYKHPILVDAIPAIAGFPLLVWCKLIGMPLGGGFLYEATTLAVNCVISGTLWATVLTFGYRNIILAAPSSLTRAHEAESAGDGRIT